MTTRVTHLNEHLRSLTALNQEMDYSDDIASVVRELNKELGINESKALSSYTTKELHDELAKRTGVYETTVNLEEEAIITIVTGQQDETKSFSGPARILVNQD